MLDFLGTIGGNILSLPGVLGLALGMMTRNSGLAAIMGGVVGLAEALTFANFSIADAGMVEVVMSVVVGVLAALLGCMIRRKGTTV